MAHMLGRRRTTPSPSRHIRVKGPGTTSPSSPGVDTSTQPGGEWAIAAGVYGISVGSSSSQLNDSAHVFLSGHAQPGQLDGLFGWPLS